ncbi:E3 ubiquitin-protein ligase RNF123 [Liparis tanakae]|uniref:E3 ubiquitin-protein ligase RNF123 n=1 Tax=Liparis tanakae TaxID=230148 RepID=A0A4Z2EC49_9TELE|nr:E3 ubiquitin-protein ligase RNF123 [Liparis tanakae]
MSSKGGGTALTRRNYRLASDTDKPKATGIVNEKLLSDYLHQVFPPTQQGPVLASLRCRLLAESLFRPSLTVSGHQLCRGTRQHAFIVKVHAFVVKVIGHSNFSSIRASTCVYKGESNITSHLGVVMNPKTFSALGFTAR